MRQTLQLKLGQQLAMTPQLQQAIRLLQLSTLELQVEVQEALESNLMLEADEGDPTPDAPEPEVAPADIPDELPVDSAWEDVFDAAPAGPAPVNGTGEGGDFEAHRSADETLASHLLGQLELLRLSDTDRVIENDGRMEMLKPP